MRTLMFLFISFIVTSCSYRVTNTTNNYYNCCPSQATWIDTIGKVGSYNIHAIGTRKDITYIFSQNSITTIRGFRVIEVLGTDYTIEVVNPNY